MQKFGKFSDIYIDYAVYFHVPEFEDKNKQVCQSVWSSASDIITIEYNFYQNKEFKSFGLRNKTRQLWKFSIDLNTGMIIQNAAIQHM